MPIAGYFDLPFGLDGDRTAVPDDSQPDGSVSYDQGYGPDYELDPTTDPDALLIERRKMNQLFYDMTLAIQAYQQFGTPQFITTTMNGGTPYSYPIGARAAYDPGSGIRTYVSLANSNTALPTDATKWADVTVPSTTGRILLTANTSYYVSTTGNDSHAGTSGSPWLTLQHAINYVLANIDLGGFTLTINVANGTYSAGVVLAAPFVGGGSVVLQGNISVPSSCIISTTSSDCINLINNAVLSVGGFKMTTATSGNCFSASYGAIINQINPVEFGAVASGAGNHIVSAYGAKINMAANYTISGGGNAHFVGQNGGISLSTITVTATGTPVFSSSYAFAFMQALSELDANLATFTGAATGPHYISQSNSVIFTAGGGPTFFPGSTPGSTATGGQYI